MKSKFVALSVVAFSAAGTLVYLGVQLADTREQLAQESTARAAAEARVRELESQRPNFQASLGQERTAIPTATPGRAVASPARPSRFSDRGPPDGFGGAPWGRGPGRGEGRNDFDNTPAGQHARLVEEEVRLRRLYADMPKVMGLDAAQADKLFNLIAEHQMAVEDAERDYNGDRAGRKALEAQQAEDLSTAIQDMFGSQTAEQFQAYQQSVPARRQVDRMGESMTAANAPLSDAQRESMIAAMVSEQQAVPRPQRPADGSFSADYQAQLLSWQQDYSARVQARVEPLLTPPQQATYEEQVALQNARRASQLARIQNQQNSQGPDPAPRATPLKQ
jgi:hypothetical protein